MERIYLQESTTRLSMKAGQLVVEEADGATQAHPICATEQVEVYGNAQVTTQAVKECLKEGVRINYFTSRGKYLGRLEPGYPKNVRRRMEQYRLYFDVGRRVSWCKALLSAKVQGELVELRRQREQGRDFPYGEIRAGLLEGLEEIRGASGLAELLGAEGRCARVYYEMFRYVLPSGVEWRGRSYHPAQDGVNELLSCVYRILSQRLREQIEHWSLDPHCGFLHEPCYGGGGLAYDLVEPLRATVGDHLALRLLRKEAALAEVACRIGPGRMGDELFREVGRLVDEGMKTRYHRQQWTPREQVERLVEMTVKGLEGDGEAPDFASLQPER